VALEEDIGQERNAMGGKVELKVDRDFVLADVPPRLFGSFAEHLGRCVYGGLYEPGHPQADGNGFRKDVLALVKELGVTVVRYPGGNFVSGYNWEDGVGPREKRPVRRDLAWLSTETNQFGTNEFIDWCRLADVQPMLACNLGTRGFKEAGEYAEYCNHPGGTALSDLRRAHGWERPHNVTLWCLGNEMDGPWQMGNLPAEEYGRRAREAAKVMHFPDFNRTSTQIERTEFVVCGSSARAMPQYAEWDETVLEQCFEKVDYLSVHSYVDPTSIDTQQLLAFPETMGKLIREITAVCDAVAAKRKSDKRIMLSYDEWNVWYMGHPPIKSPAWSVAPPLLEDVYTVADALCVGGMLITLLNHCDRVRIACQAQLVNVIGLIMTRTGGPAWRQTIFHPFAQTANLAKGDALRVVGAEKGPTVTAGKDVMPAVTSAAVATEGGGLVMFVLNRSLTETIALETAVRGFARELKVVEHLVLADADLKATNTEANPDRVTMKRQSGSGVSGGKLSASLPPASWHVIRLD
jgi:alpha-L-arabinofuranosidase